MRSIDISDLKIREDLVFSNVECRLLLDDILLGDTGSLTQNNIGNFVYYTCLEDAKYNMQGYAGKAYSYELNMVDQQIRERVENYMRQGYQCLAKVIGKPSAHATGEQKRVVILYLVFVLTGKNMGELQLMVSDKVKKTLLKKKIMNDNDNINEVMSKNFFLSDGRARIGCFLYFNSTHEEAAAEQKVVDYDEPEKKDEESVSEAIVDDEKLEEVEPSVDETKEILSTDKEEEELTLNTDSFDEDDKEFVAEPVTEISDNIDRQSKGIILYGATFNAVVVVIGTEDDKKLMVKRYLPKSKNSGPMMLGKGNLVFTDNAQAIDKSIEKLFSDSAQYIYTWNKYSNMEGEFLLKRAREIGELAFDHHQKASVDSEGNIELILAESAARALMLLSTNDTLENNTEIPPYLIDYGLTWDEYKGICSIQNSEKGNDNSNQKDKTIQVKGKPIKIINIDNRTCSITLECKEIPKGHLYLSLVGNMMQIRRREAARDIIMNGQVPNPRIAMIIANNLDENAPKDYAVNVENVSHVNPLSKTVSDKIFTYPPTPTQVEAIDIALNTPDIAIIQGPPGTGKTTVITAILERLNELSDKNNIKQGSVLITSLQHDAVNNVIERIRINSLPTIKFGKKIDQNDTIESSVDQWCDKMAERIRKENPNIEQATLRDKLDNQFNLYAVNPSDEAAVTFLQYMSSICVDINIKSRIGKIQAEIKAIEDNGNDDLLKLIRRLRTNGAAFLDDGPDNAGKLYYELADLLPQNKENLEILDTLKCAYRMKGCPIKDMRDKLKENNMQLLKKLRCIKKTLLEKSVARPVYKLNSVREDVAEIYENLKQQIRKPRNRADAILLDLLDELENNQSDVRNAVAKYSYAFAATAQQSEGKDIRRAKGITDKTEHPVYGTVIVDEAARVNPGDLMLPLSQAKDRIILVGDHRQLPHMYDEEIFEAMQEKGETFNEADVKVSMFKLLLDKAKALQKIDHKKRFITLDKQYRTHRILGEFVSKEFYEPDGEGYGSPLDDKFFIQHLYDKPLVWIDVPYETGREEKRGLSRYRTVEAEVIAEKIDEFLKKDEEKLQEALRNEEAILRKQSLTEQEISFRLLELQHKLEDKQLTYGVITFYSAQTSKIKSELRRKLKGSVVDKLYKQQKLRVGSVDAFQGMEFDVIFLSVVRTGNKPLNFDPSKDRSLLALDIGDNKDLKTRQDKLAASNYGFLTSPNRMCVAMSRQKKLLIVVGDKNIFVGEKYKEIAERFVPGMKHLYELCTKEGVLLELSAKDGKIHEV